MAGKVERLLPKKARLVLPITGSKGQVRRRWFQRQPKGTPLQGMLLLSRRQLRQIIGAEATSISMLEPFQLQLFRWGHAHKPNTIELNVVVSQGATRIAFCVELSQSAVPEEIPQQQSTAPFIESEAFTTVWHGLTTFAELHSHPALPLIHTDLQEETSTPQWRKVIPIGTRLKQTDTTLQITIDEPIWWNGGFIVLGFMQWFVLPACALAVHLYSSPELDFTLYLKQVMAVALFSNVLLLGFIFLISKPRVLNINATLDKLTLDSKYKGDTRSTVALATTLDQLYVSPDPMKGCQALWGLDYEGGFKNLLSGLNYDEAAFIEERLEHFFSIEDKLVEGEL